jgi:hypothetical protein
MINLEGFTVVAGRAFYRPSGTVSFDTAVDWVATAISAARREQVAELLVDSTALFGFATPDTFQRFLAVVNWAEGAEGRLRLVMVAREELIDPQRFGVTVGLNRNLVNNIFTAESEAIAWLDTLGIKQ